MALRFTRRFKILPGLTLNISKRGFGVSAGIRGATVSTNSAGQTSRSIGIPGTGLSSRTRILKNERRTKDSSSQIAVEIVLDEDLFREIVQSVESNSPTARVAFDSKVNYLLDVISETKFQNELQHILNSQNSHQGNWICGFLAPDTLKIEKLIVSVFLIKSDFSIAQVGNLRNEVGNSIYKELSQVMVEEGVVIPLVASIEIAPPGANGLKVISYLKSSKIHF